MLERIPRFARLCKFGMPAACLLTALSCSLGTPTEPKYYILGEWTDADSRGTLTFHESKWTGLTFAPGRYAISHDLLTEQGTYAFESLECEYYEASEFWIFTSPAHASCAGVMSFSADNGHKWTSCAMSGRCPR